MKSWRSLNNNDTLDTLGNKIRIDVHAGKFIFGNLYSAVHKNVKLSHLT